MGYFQLAFLQAVHFHLFGQEVFVHDVVFFVLGVTVKINDFQAVPQRAGNVGQRVGRRDKHHLGNIVRHVQKVIGKFLILFRVQQFQQGSRRVPAPIRTHFVNFVQQEHRVGAFGLADALDNAPRHRADIRPAVAADFAFVTHAAQRHTHEFAPQGPRNGFSQRRFAHTRRTRKAQHRPAQRVGQLVHGQVFQNAFFGFFQAKVVLVQNSFGFFQVQYVLGGFVPRHIHQPIQVRARHRGLRRERSHFGQAVHFFFGRFFGSRRQAVLFDFGPQRVQFLLEIVLLAQFFLNGFHLLIQIVFFLVLFNLRADFGVDFFFQSQNFHFAGDEL